MTNAIARRKKVGAAQKSIVFFVIVDKVPAEASALKAEYVNSWPKSRGCKVVIHIDSTTGEENEQTFLVIVDKVPAEASALKAEYVDSWPKSRGCKVVIHVDSTTGEENEQNNSNLFDCLNSFYPERLQNGAFLQFLLGETSAKQRNFRVITFHFFV